MDYVSVYMYTKIIPVIVQDQKKLELYLK